MSLLGEGLLDLAWGLGLIGTLAAFYGGWRREARWVEVARRIGQVMAPLLTLMVLALEIALLTDDFRLVYVTQVSRQTQPLFLKITALWGGQNGSLLFWSWLMSLFLFAAMARADRFPPDMLPYMTGILLLTQTFFLLLNRFFANPFEMFPVPPADGRGLNPLLRHPGMIAHPPLLYLGFVGFTVPYAIVMAALMAGRRDESWLRLLRRWTLVAWLFLSLGLLVGARWAYDVLGWGGYWGWDPVENAALLPWLTGTAFLHSVMVQERRGMLKVWTSLLIILTYALVILGTFITRTGVIASVHAFARSAIGVPFLIYVGMVLVGSLTLLAARWDLLRAENRVESWLSRETFFLLNNWLFLGIAFAVFWGTFYPMFSELLFNEKLTVGPPYYNRVTGPLFGALYLLMGVIPFIRWRRTPGASLRLSVGSSLLMALGVVVLAAIAGIRPPWALLGFGLCAFAGWGTLLDSALSVGARRRATGEPWLVALVRLVARNPRRYGGYLVHLGVVLIGIGVIGSQFDQQETQRTMGLGDSLAFGGYRLVYHGIRQYTPATEPDVVVTEAWVRVYDRSGRLLTDLYPYVLQYDTGESLTPPALRATLKEDLYLLLSGWMEGGNRATFKVFINPLVSWIWIGGIVLILGTLVAVWPRPALAPALGEIRPPLQKKPAPIS
ncbi:heme lyase CcmF/NrfE family subunit [Thermoflexus sp.]|uniref:heme lyase CcmF/NrfE family subunit n=1 Tax=Thermoflexus sp. TaxID=1969742 RepID=UPI002ADDB9C8|nr:heme lyase CcmF/NrfE family subunit [Thermoflexus sp.]